MTGGRAIRGALVGLVAALGLLPIATWIPGGRATAGYGLELDGWLSGGAIVVGGAVVLALCSERFAALWRPGAMARGLAALDPASGRALIGVAVLALGVYLLTAGLVFDARPLHIDEIVQVLQARMYLPGGGGASVPTPADPALTSILHLVDHGGRRFGHFPPGGPGWLALGEALGAGWLAVPVAGAVSVFAWGLILRAIEPRAPVRSAALLLFALAPFVVFMAGTRMNHVAALMWLLLGTAALTRVVAAPGKPAPALGMGLCFGLAAITRPADAAAWGIAAGAWLAILAARDRRIGASIGLAVAGGLGPLVVLGLVNAATTGSPLVSGYRLLWGEHVGLGFHAAPMGPAHTPARGLELLGLYLFRLNVYLFEAPIPALVPGLLALGLVRSLSHLDRYLLGAAALILGLHFAYWFEGFYPGPRFVFTLAPVAALWTARLPSIVADRFGGGRLHRGVVYAGGLAVAIAAGVGVPARARQYAEGLRPLRWDVDRAAEAAGVRDAIVLVRESWGAELVARMSGLGLARPEVEGLYRNVDACVLDSALATVEAGAPRGPDQVYRRLAPLQADSARLIPSPLSSDSSERALPGRIYAGACVDRLRDDRDGYTLFAPVLLSRRSDLEFVRDLQARSAAVVRDRPGRPVYLLRRRPDAAWPAFEALPRDSVVALVR